MQISRIAAHTVQRSDARPSIVSMLLAFLLLLPALGTSSAAANEQGHATRDAEQELPRDFLTQDSVVLITGAAGFIGSSLALALHRTYQPRRIICVDRMNPKPQSEEELALLEFQRQRTFSVLQTLGSVGQFWRVDVRPSIPDYFDLGEVPVLDHIFREHPDITHIVHLADPSAHPQSPLQQIVSREKDNPKAGMMEALLEQMAKLQREDPDHPMPHFVFASSSDVYPHATTDQAAHQPLVETLTISTPRSFRGTSKLMDEMLCKLYHDLYGLYGVGLRFFSVYGPWSVPGTPLFEMAERAVSGDSNLLDGVEGTLGMQDIDSISDYVYIDDAVNAIMAAMQYRPRTSTSDGNVKDKPHPVIFNVASGSGSSLRDIASIMQEYFPPKDEEGNPKHPGDDTSSSSAKPRNVAVGSIERANAYLGYKPQTELKQGIVQMLAWHYDRAFPYGGRIGQVDEKSTLIAKNGIVSCRPFDEDCLNGIPVFPCSSECSHEGQCTPSFYDPIVGWTQTLTKNCKTVLYTVDFDESLESLPSTHVKLRDGTKSFVTGKCNLAFVSESSALVKSLRQRSILQSLWSGGNHVLYHGQWILVPLAIPSVEDNRTKDMLRLLPKLSPGLFFGPKTTRAIFIEPNLLVESISKLLDEASTQPYKEGMEGATAMLIGKGEPNNSLFASTDGDGDDDVLEEPRTDQVLPSVSSAVQNAAYRMIRIAVKDQLFGDGNFMDLLDSRWLVHTLQSDDSRLFRCDVFGEVVQWKVDSDRSALEFILGLHDMFSRVMMKQSLGIDPWWVGDGVKTVREGSSGKHYSWYKRVSSNQRRLLETEAETTTKADQGRDVADGSENDEGDDEAGAAGDDPERASEQGNADGKAADVEINDDDEIERVENVVDEGNAVKGVFGGEVEHTDQEVRAVDSEKRGDSSDLEDEIAEEIGYDYEGDWSPLSQRDYSAYDAWMGVLSAKAKRYFVRIVPSSEVGVVSYEEYLRSLEQQEQGQGQQQR